MMYKDTTGLQKAKPAGGLCVVYLRSCGATGLQDCREDSKWWDACCKSRERHLRRYLFLELGCE